MVFEYNAELKKLKRIFKSIPADKRKLVDGLIADASFQCEQLEQLRLYIVENGWSESYKNGENQFGKKTSVEADTYLKMQKSYQSIIRQLTDLLPSDKEDGVVKAGESLAGFVMKGKGYELR